MVNVKFYKTGHSTISLNISEYMWTYLKVKGGKTGIFQNNPRINKFIELLSQSTDNIDDKKLVEECDVINEWYKIEMEA